MLKEHGTDLYDISKWLGHNSITTTADIYGHVTEISNRGVADQMDSILAPRAASEQ
jgi:site-specific recombinase XerD